MGNRKVNGVLNQGKSSAASPVRPTAQAAGWFHRRTGTGASARRKSRHHRNASAPANARAMWKSGNQRKLHRNTPALGTMQRTSATTVNPTSQRRFAGHRSPSPRRRQRSKATAATAASGTRLPANSLAGRANGLPAKSGQSEPQDGVTSPGSARHGTTQALW